MCCWSRSLMDLADAQVDGDGLGAGGVNGENDEAQLGINEAKF